MHQRNEIFNQKSYSFICIGVIFGIHVQNTKKR